MTSWSCDQHMGVTAVVHFRDSEPEVVQHVNQLNTLCAERLLKTEERYFEQLVDQASGDGGGGCLT